MDQPVQYETLKSEEIRYGPRDNKFIEISRKKAPDQTEFFMISKGFYNQQDEKRYQKGVGFPYDETIVKFIADKLKNFSKGKPEVMPEDKPPEEPKAEEAPEAPAEEPKAEEPKEEAPAEEPAPEEPAAEEPVEEPAAEEAPAEEAEAAPEEPKAKKK